MESFPSLNRIYATMIREEQLHSFTQTVNSRLVLEAWTQKAMTIHQQKESQWLCVPTARSLAKTEAIALN